MATTPVTFDSKTVVGLDDKPIAPVKFDSSTAVGLDDKPIPPVTFDTGSVVGLDDKPYTGNGMEDIPGATPGTPSPTQVAAQGKAKAAFQTMSTPVDSAIDYRSNSTGMDRLHSFSPDRQQKAMEYAQKNPGQTYVRGVPRGIPVTNDQLQAAGITSDEYGAARDYIAAHGAFSWHPIEATEQIGRGIHDVAGSGVMSAPNGPDDSKTFADMPRDFDLAAKGATEGMSGTMELTKPLMAAGIASAPVRSAALYGAGALAGKGASSIAANMGATPNEQALAETLGFFLPDMAVKAGGFNAELGPRTARVPGADGEINEVPVKTAAIGGRGFGFGVGKDESGGYYAAGRVGPFSARAKWGGSPEAPAMQPEQGPRPISGQLPAQGQDPTANIGKPVDPARAYAQEQQAQAAAAMADADALDQAAKNVVNGQPPAPVQPKKPLPPGMDDGELRPEVIQKAGEIIASAPPEKRAQILAAAHDRLAQWAMEKGKVIGPDGQITIIKNPEQAQQLAAKWINDEVTRQTTATQDAQKQQQKAAQDAQKAADKQQKEAEANGTPTLEQRAKTLMDANPERDPTPLLQRQLGLGFGAARQMVEKIRQQATVDQAATVGGEGHQVVEESRATVDKQVEALKAGTIKAVMIPEGSSYTPKVPDGMKRVDVKNAPGAGTWLYNPRLLRSATIREAARAGTHGDILGHVATKEQVAESSLPAIVQAVDHDGTVLQDSAVAHPSQVEAQSQSLRERYPSAHIRVVPSQEALADRLRDNGSQTSTVSNHRETDQSLSYSGSKGGPGSAGSGGNGQRTSVSGDHSLPPQSESDRSHSRHPGEPVSFHNTQGLIRTDTQSAGDGNEPSNIQGSERPSASGQGIDLSAGLESIERSASGRPEGRDVSQQASEETGQPHSHARGSETDQPEKNGRYQQDSHPSHGDEQSHSHHISRVHEPEPERDIHSQQVQPSPGAESDKEVADDSTRTHEQEDQSARLASSERGASIHHQGSSEESQTYPSRNDDREHHVGHHRLKGGSSEGEGVSSAAGEGSGGGIAPSEAGGAASRAGGEPGPGEPSPQVDDGEHRDKSPWEHREDRIAAAVKEWKNTGRLVWQLPYGVETMRGVHFRSLRDGSGGTITTVGTDNLVRYQDDNGEDGVVGRRETEEWVVDGNRTVKLDRTAGKYTISGPIPKNPGIKGELLPTAEPEGTTPEKALAKGDRVTFTDRSGTERAGEVKYTDGRIVRITADDDKKTYHEPIEKVKAEISKAAPDGGAEPLFRSGQKVHISGEGFQDSRGNAIDDDEGTIKRFTPAAENHGFNAAIITHPDGTETRLSWVNGSKPPIRTAGEPSPPAVAPTAKATPEQIGQVQKDIDQLIERRAEVARKYQDSGGYSGPDGPSLSNQNVELTKQIHAKEDDLARMKGDPTRDEKRAMQTATAAKPFTERPKDALKYTAAEQSQHWQVVEPDYVEKRFQQDATRYQRAIEEKKAEIAKLKPGVRRTGEEATLHAWERSFGHIKDRNALQAQKYKHEYVELVKKAISKGSPVPDAVIAQYSEFRKAQDARERYEKGRHTSFANRSAAINDTTQKEDGFKVKRQDGKEITPEQVVEVQDGVSEIASVLGEEVRDMMRGTDLTIAHTSGKHPFLSDAGGMYHPLQKTVSAGISDRLGRPIRALAHEIGHWFDFEAGKVMGLKADIRKGSTRVSTNYASEADAAKNRYGTDTLYNLARKSITDTREVQHLLKVTKLSDLEPEKAAEVERVKVVLGPYWHDPREVFARLFEQYISTQLGRGGLAAESPERYQKSPGWWSKEAFAKLEPLVKADIDRRMVAMRERYAPKADLQGMSEMDAGAKAQVDVPEVRKDKPHATPMEAEMSVQRLPVSELLLDPRRFQYKLNTDATGVTNLLKGRKWNDDLAGIVTVWRDPSNGRVFVVNGHHRAQLAKESGVKQITVRMLSVPNAEEARAIGALQNIAEGRGTAIDAAKFFRDTGMGPADLDAKGISLGEATAANGLALSRLAPHVFEDAVSGRLRVGRAIAIGNATAVPEQQEAILRLIQKRERNGRRVPDEVVDEMGRLARTAGEHTETQHTLFGAQDVRKNLVLEKAEVSAYVRSQIAQEKRLFSGVSDENKAERLGRAGNTINAARNAEIATQASQAQELYDRLSARTGDVDGILNQAAARLAKGDDNPARIKAVAYEAIRRALSETLGRSEGEGAGRVQRDTGRPALPGLEGAVREQHNAALEEQGRQLSAELQKPPESIEKAAGEMERNSPLFAESEANPQSNLFRAAPPDASHQSLMYGGWDELAKAKPEYREAMARGAEENLARARGTMAAPAHRNDAPMLRLNVAAHVFLRMATRTPEAVWLGCVLDARAASTWIGALNQFGRKASGEMAAAAGELSMEMGKSLSRNGHLILLSPLERPSTAMEEQFHVWQLDHDEAFERALDALKQLPVFQELGAALGRDHYPADALTVAQESTAKVAAGLGTTYFGLSPEESGSYLSTLFRAMTEVDPGALSSLPEMAQEVKLFLERDHEQRKPEAPGRTAGDNPATPAEARNVRDAGERPGGDGVPQGRSEVSSEGDKPGETLGERTESGERDLKAERDSVDGPDTPKYYSGGIGAVFSGAGKAAQPVLDLLRVPEEYEKVRTSRDLQEGLYSLESQANADVLRAKRLMERTPGTPADYAAIYHHIEDPKLPLTELQRRILDDYISPMMAETAGKVEEMREDGATIENYVHRIVKGKGSFIDRLLAGSKSTGRGNVLRKTVPSEKSRTMMALQPDVGTRIVVSIKGDRIMAFRPGGKVEDLGALSSGMTTRLEQLDERLEPIVRDILRTREEITATKQRDRDEYISGLKQRIAQMKRDRDLIGTVKGRVPGQQSVHGIEVSFRKRAALTEKIDKAERELEAYEKGTADVRISNRATERIRRLNESIGVLESQRNRLLEQVPTERMADRIWLDKNGKRWKITQATTKEIEAVTDLEYYHNALGSAIINWLAVEKQYRALQFLKGFTENPEFARIGMKIGDGQMAPEGWRTTDLPQLRSYYLEPHVAEVMDWYYDRLKGRAPGIYDRINDFLVSSIFFNPLLHVPNIMNHWAVEKGVSGNALLLLDAAKAIGKSIAGMRVDTSPLRIAAAAKAINAVIHQNDDFLAALDAGAPLQSQQFGTRRYAAVFIEKMQEQLEKDPTAWERTAKYLGYANPLRLLDAMKSVSSRVTWYSNDIAFLQSAYEKIAKGMDLKTALRETAKHIPDYRMPTRIFDSAGLSKTLSNKKIVMFMNYHYGALKSYGEVLKSLGGINWQEAGENEKGEPVNEAGRTRDQEKLHAMNIIAMLGLVTLVVYPELDKMLQKATGDKNAHLRVAGASTTPYNLIQMARGEKTALDAGTSIVTPSPLLKSGVELIANKDIRTGRQIYSYPTHGWETTGQQIGSRLAQSFGPTNEYVRANRQGAKKEALGLVGVSFPLHGAEKIASEIAQNKSDKQAPTPADAKRLHAKYQALDALRAGDNAKAAELIRQAGLTYRQRINLVKESRENPLLSRVESFTAEEVQQVYDHATLEEKKMLGPVLRSKQFKEHRATRSAR